MSELWRELVAIRRDCRTAIRPAEDAPFHEHRVFIVKKMLALMLTWQYPTIIAILVATAWAIQR